MFAIRAPQPLIRPYNTGLGHKKLTRTRLPIHLNTELHCYSCSVSTPVAVAAPSSPQSSAAAETLRWHSQSGRKVKVVRPAVSSKLPGALCSCSVPKVTSFKALLFSSSLLSAPHAHTGPVQTLAVPSFHNRTTDNCNQHVLVPKCTGRPACCNRPFYIFRSKDTHKETRADQ
jgi:hypothetical protein